MATSFLRFADVELAAEPLVIGYLRRRNIRTLEPEANTMGYDLLCRARRRVRSARFSEVRVQVKSRYQADCDRTVPVKKSTLREFDFLVIVFLNIGRFGHGKDGSTGARDPEVFTLTAGLARKLFQDKPKWSKVSLRGVETKLERCKGEQGFEQIAKALGIPRPLRPVAPTR